MIVRTEVVQPSSPSWAEESTGPTTFVYERLEDTPSCLSVDVIAGLGSAGIRDLCVPEREVWTHWVFRRFDSCRSNYEGRTGLLYMANQELIDMVSTAQMRCVIGLTSALAAAAALKRRCERLGLSSG
jgi:hypothetical protein